VKQHGGQPETGFQNKAQKKKKRGKEERGDLILTSRRPTPLGRHGCAAGACPKFVKDQKKKVGKGERSQNQERLEPENRATTVGRKKKKREEQRDKSEESPLMKATRTA